MANFQAGKCITWNGNARFLALKVGLDAGIPEVQINLFCAFSLDAVDPAEVQMMSGHMSIAVRGRANSSRDYVDTYAVERQRAAKPRIGARFKLRGERPRHCRMQQNAVSQRRSCDARAHEPQLCARIEKGRGRDNKLLFEQSRRFSLSLRHKPRENLGHGHQRPARMYTKVDRTWTSTAAL